MNPSIDFRAEIQKLLVANPESNIFFLLDQSGLPGLARRLGCSSVEWKNLFMHTKDKSALAVAPVLVLAGGEGQLRLPRSLLGWIGEYGTYSSTVMILVTFLNLDPLAKQLDARLDTILSENMSAMLRFFDPRVFETLLNVLTSDQLYEFLSPATSWCYVNRQAKIREVKSTVRKKHSWSSTSCSELEARKPVVSRMRS